MKYVLSYWIEHNTHLHNHMLCLWFLCAGCHSFLYSKALHFGGSNLKWICRPKASLPFDILSCHRHLCRGTRSLEESSWLVGVALSGFGNGLGFLGITVVTLGNHPRIWPARGHPLGRHCVYFTWNVVDPRHFLRLRFLHCKIFIQRRTSRPEYHAKWI